MNDKTQRWQLFIAWGFVGIPLLWGLYQTVTKSMQLFE